MRTRNGPWWVVLLLVGVWGGGVKAQGIGPAPAWWTGDPLREFVFDLPGFDDAAWAAAEQLLGIVLTGSPNRRFDDAETCAFLAGAGSKPRLDGGVGALATHDPTWDSPVVDWDQLGGTWPQVDVVIVDEFDFKGLLLAMLPLPGQAFASDDAPGWRNAVADATVRPFVDAMSPPPYDVPHGHLVLHHLLALLGGHEIAVTSLVVSEVNEHGDLGRMAIELAIQDRPFTLHLEGIRYRDVSTIKVAMHGVVETYGHQTAVVTSWGLVDCDLANRYRDVIAGNPNAPPSMGAYLERLIRESPASVRTMIVEVCRAFERWLQHSPYADGDPPPTCDDPFVLALILTQMELKAAKDTEWPFLPPNDPSVATPYGRVFASAGNQQLPFPMPPAAWPGVLGIASCDLSSELAWYSNVGDYLDQEHVRAPGGWFPVEINGFDVGYWGTSFAAPHAALALGDWSPSGDPVGVAHCHDPVRYPAVTPQN
jgi:hypothetical protein